MKNKFRFRRKVLSLIAAIALVVVGCVYVSSSTWWTIAIVVGGLSTLRLGRYVVRYLRKNK